MNAKQTLSSREEVCSVSIQAEHSDGTLKILAEGAVALKISISNMITSVGIRRAKKWGVFGSESDTPTSRRVPPA